MPRKRTKQKQEVAEEEVEASEFDNVIASIKKVKGEQSILPANKIPTANHIPTGNFMLDFALLGGVPEGYATMLYGLESSGKTSVAKKIVGEFQRKHPDKRVVWVDTEGMFDADWATQLGVDCESMVLSRPDTGNEAVDIIDAVMGALETGLIVMDSIPSCIPKQMVDSSAEDDTMAKLAQLMGKLCARVTTNWNRERKRNHNVTFLYTNQFRSKVGLVFGDPRVLPGGRQINHLPTTKLEVKGSEEMGKDQYGNEVVEVNEHEFKVVKAKHGSSVRSGAFRMIHNPDSETGIPQGGWDDTETVVTYAKRMGMVHGGGKSWKIEGVDEKFGNLKSIVQYLNENWDRKLMLMQTLIAMQRQAKNLPPIPKDGYLLDWAETV